MKPKSKASRGELRGPLSRAQIHSPGESRQATRVRFAVDGGRKLLVDMAFNGEEALLKVKAHEYDVVLAGVMMPRLRGDEFYLEATGLRTELAARFIFMTGCRRPTDPRFPRRR